MTANKINIGKDSGLKWRHLFVLMFCIISFPFQFSCRKLVDISAPQGSVTEQNVYTNDATAIAVLSGLYTNMSKGGGSATGGFSGNFGISQVTALSADELVAYSGIVNTNLYAYYTNSLQANGSVISGSEHWAPLYNFVFKCNAAIEGLNSSQTLSPQIKQQLLGEAKFLRSFFYFYLVNLYGDVPLALSTDPKINSLLSRTNVADVYKQIIIDLKDAQQLLSSSYLKEDLQSVTTDRVRPTVWAATALLARVYLYTGDYVNAETQATAVINNTTLFGPLSTVPLTNVFLKNSREAIWQIQPTTTNFNTEDARCFIIPSTGFGNDAVVYMSDQLLNSLEIGDQRFIDGNWIKSINLGGVTYYYPFKYKIASSPGVTSAGAMAEYLIVLRLGEQYLIRAEARALQNKIAEAKTDLNAIRNRSGLSNTSAVDQPSLLNAIVNERKHELFTEWGHRWFDLKRTGKIDAIMNMVTPLKANGSPWRSFQQLYPLPQSDLDKAPSLVQNIGY
jgi:hypothetical protein